MEIITPMRVLDEMAEAIPETEPRFRRSHWGSSAAAWVPCPMCENGGCAECDGKGEFLMGIQCLREEYWKHKRVPYSDLSDLSGEFKKNFGWKAEELWANWMEKLAIPAMAQVRAEVEFEELRLPVVCKSDWFIWDEGMGLFHNLSMKSGKGWDIRNMRKNGLREGYVVQAHVEAALHRMAHPKLAALMSHTKYILLARDDGYHTEEDFAIDWDYVDTVLDGAVRRFVEIEAFVDADELPPAEINNANGGNWTHWKCRYSATNRAKDGYCPYRRLCRKTEDEESEATE